VDPPAKTPGQSWWHRVENGVECDVRALGIPTIPSTMKMLTEPGIHCVKPLTFFIGVEDLWKRGNVALALILFGFSGMWPHVKMLLVIVLVIVWQNPQPRRWYPWLVWFLEVCGKWSLLDIFTVSIWSSCLHIDIAPGIAVSVSPQYGAAIFCGAVLASLIMVQAIEGCGHHHELPTASSHLQKFVKHAPWAWHIIFVVFYGAALAFLVLALAVPVYTSTTTFTLPSTGTLHIVKKYAHLKDSTVIGTPNLWMIGQGMYERHEIASVFVGVVYVCFAVLCPVCFLVLALLLWLLAASHTVWQGCPNPRRAYFAQIVMRSADVSARAASLDVWLLAVLITRLRIHSMADSIAVAPGAPKMVNAGVDCDSGTWYVVGCLLCCNVVHSLAHYAWLLPASAHTTSCDGEEVGLVDLTGGCPSDVETKHKPYGTMSKPMDRITEGLTEEDSERIIYKA